MAYDPFKYLDRTCASHGETMVVRPNGFANGKQQYRQFCLSCRSEKFRRAVDADGGFGLRAKRQRNLYPKQTRARRIVCTAIRAGKLRKQPCERCGVTENIEAHHEDYNQPLNVNWLCTRHHAERHMEILRCTS